MYACFVQYKARGWHLIEIVSDEEGLNLFIDTATDMMARNLLGDRIIGYDVHELKNQADKANL